MKTKQQILLRKALHLSLIIPFGVFWYLSYVQSFSYSQEYARWFLIVFVAVFLIYEYIRLDTKIWVPFGNLIKPKESNTNVDGLNLVLAAIVANSLFSPQIAVVSILIAIIGDTFSTIGGIYGTIKVFPKTENKTTWEGIFIALLANFFIAASILGFSLFPLVLAIIGVVIETYATRLDDNLAIPLGVGLVGEIILFITT
jgi:dolichol kinase